MGLGRVTGGVCALQGQFQGNSLFSFLLLNPPLNKYFKLLSVFPVPGSVAHFFPFRVLHLDLTCWVVPILLTIRPL